MEREYVSCYACGQMVRYEDGITIDDSGLEHECEGFETEDIFEDEDVSDEERKDTETFIRDHEV